MKQIYWLLGLVALGLVLAAFGSGGSITTSNEPPTQKINVASGGELSTLDCAHYTVVYSSHMIGQVVEGLYRQHNNAEPEI
ncbi:peptide ABC transporter substrate-binding protein, partial [Enterococcus faecalis]